MNTKKTTAIFLTAFFLLLFIQGVSANFGLSDPPENDSYSGDLEREIIRLEEEIAELTLDNDFLQRMANIKTDWVRSNIIYGFAMGVGLFGLAFVVYGEYMKRFVHSKKRR